MKKNPEYLKIAKKLTDQILKSYKSDQNGIYWENPDFNVKTDKYSINNGYNLYNFNSGIALLLIELYSITQNNHYLDIAKEGLNWSSHYIKSKQHNLSVAYITGFIGPAYVYLRLYQLTKKKEYKQELAELIEEIRRIPIENKICEYINGIAGALHILLKIDSILGNTKDLIQKYTNHLINNIQYNENHHIYWDQNSRQIKPLCGFSHGVSGIGYVFCELGYYFENPEFFKITHLTQQYEAHYFNNVENNWPDLKLIMSAPDKISTQINNYKNGQIDFLISPTYMNAWCHGAAGIGLARAREYQILGSCEYNKDMERACRKVYSDFKEMNIEKISHCMCHGLTGNAETLLSAFSVTNKEEYLEQATEIAQSLLKLKSSGLDFNSGNRDKTEIRDTSLFLGDAGIAYFFLRMYDLENVPCILAPSLQNKNTGENIFKDFKFEGLTNLTEIQKEELKLKQSIKSNALCNIAYLSNRESLEKINFKTNAYADLKLILSPYARIIFLEGKYIILVARPEKIYSQEISNPTQEVLKAFENPNCINSVIDTYLDKYKNQIKDINNFKQYVTDQAKSALKAEILFVLDAHPTINK